MLNANLAYSQWTNELVGSQLIINQPFDSFTTNGWIDNGGDHQITTDNPVRPPAQPVNLIAN